METDRIEEFVERARNYRGTFDEFVSAMKDTLDSGECFLVWRAGERLNKLAEENAEIEKRLRKEFLRRRYDTHRLVEKPKYYADEWDKANTLDFDAFVEWYENS